MCIQTGRDPRPLVLGEDAEDASMVTGVEAENEPVPKRERLGNTELRRET